MNISRQFIIAFISAAVRGVFHYTQCERKCFNNTSFYSTFIDNKHSYILGKG